MVVPTTMDAYSDVVSLAYHLCVIALDYSVELRSV